MTNHRSPRALGVCLAAALALAGCKDPMTHKIKVNEKARPWALKQVGLVGPFRMPECVLVHDEADLVYVSNMDTKDEQYWADDGVAFLSKLKAGGEMINLRWVLSSPAAPLNEPKGMCLLGNVLHVADNTRVATYSLADGNTARIDVPGAERLNDLASDGNCVYASDTGTGKIHKLAKKPVALKGPPVANGITFHKGKMFAVSWGLHEVYELDPNGKAEPKPFGLARHFTALDAIEVLDDGTFLVSDFKGNKLCAISPDRKTVTTLAKLKTPADIGLDRKRMLLYVPLTERGDVAIFRIEKNDQAPEASIGLLKPAKKKPPRDPT